MVHSKEELSCQAYSSISGIGEDRTKAVPHLIGPPFGDGVTSIESRVSYT